MVQNIVVDLGVVGLGEVVVMVVLVWDVDMVGLWSEVEVGVLDVVRVEIRVFSEP